MNRLIKVVCRMSSANGEVTVTVLSTHMYKAPHYKHHTIGTIL